MTAYMIVGGQWGSEGKGLFAGYMALQRSPDAVVSQFGPNAGHTWLEGDRPIVFKSLPVGSIAPSVKNVFLGPGSVINPEILEKELIELGPLLNGKRIFVHEAAAIIFPGDAEQEVEKVSHIASTRQGTVMAMIRKMMRQDQYPARQWLKHLQVDVVDHDMFRSLINSSKELQIEGSQGMDLSINSGFYYPYTTSRDCTPAQVLADCGVHPSDLIAIFVCIRTYPIRVGNIISNDGVIMGSSGPCYTDQFEMSWDQIGVQQEYTTVTKRVRRVFSFSGLQTQKMLRELRPNSVFLNFANYLEADRLQDIMGLINTIAGRSIVRWTGHSAKHTDIRVYGSSRPTPPIYQE